MPPHKRAALWGGLGLAVAVWLLLRTMVDVEVFERAAAGLEGADPDALLASSSWCAAIATLCAVYWVWTPIPMPATALIPFAALPLTGVLGHREVAAAYGHHLVLLMLAGAIISTAMEKSGAHRRAALGIVWAIDRLGGKGGRGLVLGFLLASAILSMWVSNTATVVMLVPVALAVLAHGDRERMTVPILLAVAYGAAVGGSATLVGTPPNLLMVGYLEDVSGREIEFLEWIQLAGPVALVMLPIVWLWLSRGLGGVQPVKLPGLGAWRPAELRVFAVFVVVALGWITRQAPFGGWSGFLGVDGTVGDSTVALAGAVVLFVLPSGESDGERLLDWETAAKIPWGVFVMIGGGMALGQGFGPSGLRDVIAESLSGLTTLPAVLMVFALCLFATFVTEVTSNTAVANVLLPIMGAVGVAAGVDPLLLMLPVTLGLNYAFMLPVATAPNAIVYGTGQLPAGRMRKEGLALNLIGAVVITGVCSTVIAMAE